MIAVLLTPHHTVKLWVISCGIGLLIGGLFCFFLQSEIWGKEVVQAEAIVSDDNTVIRKEPEVYK